MLEIIYTIVKAVCDYFQEQKKEERFREIRDYIYESKICMDKIRDCMEMSAQELAYKMLDDLRTEDREIITIMVYKLIQEGNFALAKDLNRLLGQDFRLSDESLYILKGYFSCERPTLFSLSPKVP